MVKLDSNGILDLSNINEKVYAFIKKRIIQLTYPPGHKINVRELQRELGVSQTPIKDALFRLAGEGMIEISSRRGTFVKDVTERDIREIFATRLILETGAAEIITPGMTDDQLKELELLYRETLHDEPEFTYYVFMEKDRAFHMKIIELTGNQKLIGMYDQLSAHMQIVRFRFARQINRKLPWVDKDHEQILNAFKERNPDKAKQAIREHFMKSMNAFLQNGS